MIDDIICVRLPRRLGSNSGDGGGSVSTLGSVVAPSLEESLKSSDSGVASGTSSRSGSALSRLRVPKVQVRGALPGLPCFPSSQASPRQAEDGGPRTLTFRTYK